MRNNLAMDTFRELAEEAFLGLGIKGEKIKNTKSISVSKFVFDGDSRTRLNGTYVTIAYSKKDFGSECFCRSVSGEVSAVLSELGFPHKKPLIVGLGNSSITSDSLGSQTVNALVDKKLAETMLFKPSVYGITKIESASVIKGLCGVVSPDCIIAVDTLCCIDENKLYSSIQITDAGIIPGGGLGNARTPLTKETLSVPVVSIGIPLISYSSDNLNPDSCVTPKEIDIIVKISAKLLADGIFEFLS